MFLMPAIYYIGFYERLWILRQRKSMGVLPSGNLQNKYVYCITIKKKIFFIYLLA